MLSSTRTTLDAIAFDTEKSKSLYNLFDSVLAQTEKWFQQNRFEFTLINFNILTQVFSIYSEDILLHDTKDIAFRLLKLAETALVELDHRCANFEIRKYISTIIHDFVNTLKKRSLFEERCKALKNDLPFEIRDNPYKKLDYKNSPTNDDIIEIWQTARKALQESSEHDLHQETAYQFFKLTFEYSINRSIDEKSSKINLKNLIEDMFSPELSQSKIITACITNFLFHPSNISKSLITLAEVEKVWFHEQTLPSPFYHIETIKFLQELAEASKSNKPQSTDWIQMLTLANRMNCFVLDVYSQGITHTPSFILQNYRPRLVQSRQLFENEINDQKLVSNSIKDLLTKSLQDLKSLKMVETQKQSSILIVKLLNDIFVACQKLLGEPPCTIALLLLGSTSHYNRLPYSDVELALLCDPYPESTKLPLSEQDNKIVLYVQTLSCLFDLCIVRLGESMKEGFRLDSSTSFLANLYQKTDLEEKISERLIGTPDQLIKFRIKNCIENENLEDKKRDIKCSLVEDPSLYSLFEPMLVNTEDEKTKKLFSEYQNKIKDFLNESLPALRRERLESKFLKMTNKGGSSLTYKKAAILFSFLDILQKAIPEKPSEAIDIKKTYGKPLTYFGLTINLFFDLGCVHPMDAVKKAVDRKILTPEFSSLIQQAFEYITLLRTHLHLTAKQQEECITVAESKDGISYKTLENITKYIILPLKESLTSYLIGERCSDQAIFDPGKFYIEQLQQESCPMSDSILDKLSSHLVAQSCNLSQHLSYYHLIPLFHRKTYQDILLKKIINPDFRNELEEAFASYPLEGIRPSTIFDKKLSQWDQTLSNELTKSSLESKDERCVRLVWHNSKGEKQESFLKTSYIDQLFDQNNRIRESKEKGVRRVARLYDTEGNVVAFWKHFPQMPGMQLIATAFEYQITGHGLIFTIAKAYPPNSSQGYPVLLSQPVPGGDLENIKDFKIFENQFDRRHFTFKIFESIIIGHEDLQPANVGAQYFRNSENNVSVRGIGIDTDHIVQSETYVDKGITGLFPEEIVNHKNIFYLMNMAREKLDLQAINEFLSLEPIAIIKIIFDVMKIYQDQMIKDSEDDKNGLFTRKEISNLYQSAFSEQREPGKKEQGKDACSIIKLLDPEKIHELILRFIVLQTAVENVLKRESLPKHIDVVSWINRNIGRHCHLLLNLKKSPIERYCQFQTMEINKMAYDASRESFKRLTMWPSKNILPSKLKIGNETKNYFKEMERKFIPQKSKQKKIESEIDFILNYSKEEVVNTWLMPLNIARETYGKIRSRQHLSLINKATEELKIGNCEFFLNICKYEGSTFLIEAILKQINMQDPVTFLEVRAAGMYPDVIMGLPARHQVALMQEVKRDPKIDACQSQLLSEFIKYKHKFHHLNLKKWDMLEDHHLAALAKNSGTVLKTIILSGCTKITDNGIQALANHCPRLMVLEVENCRLLTDDSISILGDKCRQLRELNLNRLTRLRGYFKSSKSSFFKGWQDAEFLKLERLEMKDCTLNTSLTLKAPNLKKFSQPFIDIAEPRYHDYDPPSP